MSIRDEVERAARELALSPEGFREIEKLKWEVIQSKLVETFVRIPHHNYRKSLHWAWESLKEPNYHLQFKNLDASSYLRNLIDDDVIWFAVEDTHDKFWFYEGKTDNIVSLIPEIVGLGEYCLASKKYEWMLCEDHHGVLHGVGSEISNRMQRFRELHPEAVAPLLRPSANSRQDDNLRSLGDRF